MRNRLGSYCASNFNNWRYEIAKLIEKETGTRVPWAGQAVSLDRFFQSGELRDILDAITLISEYLRITGQVPARNSWVAFVRRVLSEERTTYALDSAGTVQFAVDPSYAASRVEVIAGLSQERWALARQEVEHSFQEMDVSPKNTNSAIRSMAAAVESIAKGGIL